MGFLLLWGVCDLPAQSALLPLHSPQAAENVDYHSFSPALLLKHRIGNDFKKLPKNPVVTPSPASWDRQDAADPFILVTADSILLFYDGDDNDRYHIGYAVRDDLGWGWKKRRKLISGSGAEWDSYHQIAPVVVVQEGKWLLYYNGNLTDSELGYQWGLAARGNPGGWFYSPDLPLMALDSTAWDFAGNAYGDVLYFPEEKKFKMWYTGFQGPLAAIGLAESADGVHWKKHSGGPVLSLLPGVISPEVIFDGQTYTMYFVQLYAANNGMGTKICRAQSGDGIHWENAEDVLLPGGGWEGQKLMRPNLSYFEGRAQLYYCAARGGSWRIGAAYTEAEFSEAEGRWLSQTQQGNFRFLQIKYEQPAETSLTVSFIDAISGQVYPASLEGQKSGLRKDVFQSVIPVPPEIQSRQWQVELKLHTTNPHRSPVVYEILMSN